MERSWLDRMRAALQYLFGRWPVLLHDAVAACLAWLGAYWFRFNLDEIPDVFLDQALAVLPLVVFWHLVFFVVFGVHRGAWRFTCLLYTSPSPRDYAASRMPSSA